jgi:predicted dehydrogenase
MGALVNRDVIRLAMLGMVDGNGHPYSWSAMFNGYNREEMDKCPFAGIPVYLNKEPKETLRIPNARVTHVWTDDPADAPLVAKASLIDNVVARPEDVIGQVDAVIVATDKGHEHVERCRPFIEAGLPVFVDKPLVDNEADLQTFHRWVAEGKPIMSSSCMRYAKEFMPYRISTHELGTLRYAGITMAKTWERYGIHAMEGLYTVVGPGFISVRNTGTIDRNIVHCKHQRGADVVAIVTKDLFGAFGVLQLAGTAGHAEVAFTDTFYSFKTQLENFIAYLRTGERPFPWAETEELMQIIIAGIRSRVEGGREVMLDEIKLEAGVRA